MSSADLEPHANFIAGEPGKALSGEVIEVIDPSDGRPFATVP